MSSSVSFALSSFSRAARRPCQQKSGGLQLSRPTRGPQRHVASSICRSTRRWKQADPPSPHAHRPGVGPEVPGAQEFRGHGGTGPVGAAEGVCGCIVLAATILSFRHVVSLVVGCWFGMRRPFVSCFCATFPTRVSWTSVTHRCNSLRRTPPLPDVMYILRI